MGFKWKFDIKGFGPFLNGVSSTLSLSNSKVAIYAGNGQGKTCISRIFRASEQGVGHLSDDYISHSADQGSFSFEILEKDGTKSSLSVRKTLGNQAVVQNDTSRLFHVFNSDYVQENLASRHFTLSSDIQGYILGKENIDLSEKKAELERLKNEVLQYRHIIEEAVTSEKNALEALSINKQMKEYKNFTVDAVLDLKQPPSNYDKALEEYEALKQLPDDIARFKTIEWDIDDSLFDQTIRLLETSYSRDSFSEAFVEEMDRKHVFVREGMRLEHEKRCPFCGQELKESALSLIEKYEDYLSSKQAETIDQTDSLCESFRRLCQSYARLIRDVQNQHRQFEDLLPAFPSHKSFAFPVLPEYNSVAISIDEILRALEMKKSNISEPVATQSVVSLRETLEGVHTKIGLINQELQQFDKDVQKVSDSLRAAKKKLCYEAMLKVGVEYSDAITERSRLLERFEELKKEIDHDESRSKKPKRDAVGEMLARLIHTIFGKKYAFNKNSFELFLQGGSALSSPAEVMSDGEKSVLAFCHYVSSTFELFENDIDAEKLFFVIDDPISSLDFHYVYGVVQIIRNLDSLFSIDRVRMIVLTHNTAFFNLLARNNIACEHFLLNNGYIDKCPKRILVPYSAHLTDIYNVAKGDKPSHTTGNSLRQIIETIWRFDDPSANDLRSYLEKDKCSSLKECEYLYSLCNDQSHGASIFDRMQPIDEDSVRRACIAVLGYVHNRFPGQLIAGGIDISSIQL